MAKAKKSAAELLKEAAEKAGIPMEIATILHKLGEATPKTEEPTLTAEGVESLVTSAVEEEPVEKKPPFISGKYKTLGGYFRVDEGVYAVLKRNIQKSVNTLLLGPTGVGKTELVSNIAKALDLPITIFDMGTMTDPIMSLVGNHVIKMHDGVTTSTFVKSRFSEVIQQPGIVFLTRSVVLLLLVITCCSHAWIFVENFLWSIVSRTLHQLKCILSACLLPLLTLVVSTQVHTNSIELLWIGL